MRWLTLLLLAPLAVAQGSPGFEDPGTWDDCAGATWEREGDHRLDYGLCTGPQNGAFEVVRLNVDLEGKARLHMEGFSAQGLGTGILAFAYDLELLQVVEFIDDGDGRYVPGVDAIAATYSLAHDWSPIRTQARQSGLSWEADHPLGEGTFTLGATATGTRFSAGSVLVHPLDTKFDFSLHNVTVQAPESRLALVLRVLPDHGAQSGIGTTGHVIQPGEAGVVSSRGPTHAFFTWSTTADVDGTPRPVMGHVDIHTQGGGQSGDAGQVASGAGITLTYPRGSDIVHDARLGVQFQPQADSPGLPLAGLLVAVAVARVLRS